LPEPHDFENCPYPDIINPLVDVDHNGRSNIDGLTKRQRDFCEAALDLMQQGEHNWKRKAALAAGYAESWAASAAWQMTRNEAVQQYIGSRLAGAASKNKVDRSYVLQKAMIGAELAEAKGDLRSLSRFIDIVAKHTDVSAFTPDAVPGAPGGGASVNLPFDIDALSTDEKRTFLDLVQRARVRPSVEPGGSAKGVDP
jgi:hypothetical protein